MPSMQAFVLNPKKITQGLISGACWRPSPNYNQRPENTLIDTLIVHGITLPPGQFGGGHIERFFQNQLDVKAHPYFASIAELQVSAHLLIKRTGELVQFVNFNDRAWHAGRSYFAGRTAVNDFSIGIELEGTDDCPYSLWQYQQLASVTQALQIAFPAITCERIVGHSDIAPGRKTDPGPAFNWPLFWQLLAT